MCVCIIHMYVLGQEIWEKYVILERGIIQKFRLWLLFRSVSSRFAKRFGLHVLFSHLGIYNSLGSLGYSPPFQLCACFKLTRRFGPNLFLVSLQIFSEPVLSSFAFSLFTAKGIIENQLDGCFRRTCGCFGMLQLNPTVETLPRKEIQIQQAFNKIYGNTIKQINAL